MPSASRVHAAKAARVAASAHTLTIVYPPAVTPLAVSGSPVSPLTGPKSALALAPSTVTPSAPSVEMSCIWYDAITPPSATPGVDARQYGRVVWLQGAHALAEVLVADAALDPNNPAAGTKFDTAQTVTHGGQSYRVLSAKLAGAAGFAVANTYYVWLATVAGQVV